MQAVADSKRLVTDGVITEDQAGTIEARARETMIFLAINALLCLGILAATGGFILFLGKPSDVAVTGLFFMGTGALILAYGSDLFRMFGNAAALIGAGMLIGGAGTELLVNHKDIAGATMALAGAGIAGAAAWLFGGNRTSALFVTGAILLMGLAMHLTGLGYLLHRSEIGGPVIGAFYLYATAAIVAAGWLLDVRLVTALAIVPFAQALETGGLYFHAAYVFYSPESTLSILKMAALIAACLWIAAQRPERTARHARILAVMAFVVANLCALVGSLFGDWIGETIWRPVWTRADGQTWESASRAFRAETEAFRETAIIISADVYSIAWAVVLAALVLWAAHSCRRGLFNAALTFAAIHAYTQYFESYFREPLAYVIGGLVAIPIAWGMWRLDRWIVDRRDGPGSRERQGAARREWARRRRGDQD
jgi:hypothetical protein